MLGKIEGRKRREWHWQAWHGAIHEVTKSQTQTTPPKQQCQWLTIDDINIPPFTLPHFIWIYNSSESMKWAVVKIDQVGGEDPLYDSILGIIKLCKNYLKWNIYWQKCICG